MIRSQAKAQPKPHEYQTKHRLIGAAIIVGIAIVVISVLLKEPSIETNRRLANNTDSRQTFKLEIPLPNSDNQNSSLSEDSTGGYDDNDAKPALLVPKIAVPVGQIPTTSKTEGGGEGKDEGENIVLTKDKKPDSGTNSGTNSGINSGTNSVSSQSKPTNSGTPAQSDESSKDISKTGSGWTIRVGTYSKTENVDSVSALLNSHGFDAQHTKVQTALGAATRIWLGPYIQKKTAEKVSIRLKLITGEKGYVTKTSS